MHTHAHVIRHMTRDHTHDTRDHTVTLYERTSFFMNMDSIADLLRH